jgi:glutamate formiminotransferase
MSNREQTTEIVECVPNISEGKDLTTIDRIVESVVVVPGVQLLHRDSGADAHRTVLTFTGRAKELEEGLFRLFVTASEQIDMRKHRGAHPRIGAVDVCPFIPLQNSSISECIALSHALSLRVATELKIPIYLYESAALTPERVSLASIRRGEFECLSDKMRDPKWVPDYGPSSPHPTAGASVIGARNLLIAFNVSLATNDLSIAQALAAVLRTQSLNCNHHRSFVEVMRPAHSLPALRAIGWSMPQYRCTQVSFNLLDYRVTSLFTVFDTCCRIAKLLGAEVVGSEIIGMVPLDSLIDNQETIINTNIIAAINKSLDYLRANVHTNFVSQEKILDFRMPCALGKSLSRVKLT